MCVIGTNPLVSLPDQNRTEQILRRLFLMVQDPSLDAETVDLADIYLPAAMSGEKTGRSTTLNERAPLPDVEIHPTDAARLGTGFGDLVEITSPNGRWKGVPMVVDTVRLAELNGESKIPFAALEFGGTVNRRVQP